MKKPVIGIVSKNLTVEEFYSWSWQRISDGVRYAINKNGGLVMGILPQTIRKNFNKEDESENIKLTREEIDDLLFFVKKCDGIILQGGLTSHNYEGWHPSQGASRVGFFFLINFVYLLFLVVLGLPCCMQAFSGCGELGYTLMQCSGSSLLLLLQSTGSTAHRLQ